MFLGGIERDQWHKMDYEKAPVQVTTLDHVRTLKKWKVLIFPR